MMINVFVTLVPKITILNFILIICSFLWTGKARLIRSKVLSESELDYIAAAKALGTSNTNILFSHLLPNVSSLIIVAFTLNLAGNIGIKSGLTF